MSGNRSYRSVRCIQLVTRLGRGSEATEAVFLLSGKNAPSYRGAHRVPLFNLSVLSVCVCLCVSVSVCVTFVVFTDCESCTRPISTNLGSMEAGECGLTRGTCFLACRLELDAVAGLLWISWCVLGGADFSVFFFFDFFFFERTRPAASMRPPCLIYLYTSTGVPTGCHYFISLSVCVCNMRRFY